MPGKTSIAIACVLFVGTAAAADFEIVPDWLKLPEGRTSIGNMHGDVAVSAAGDVYLSVQDPEAGVQVYAPDGTFLHNLPNAPSDFHGFVIRQRPDGEFLFGTTLRGQTIVKMSLDGEVLMTIPASAIPDRFKVRNARSGQLGLLLTGLDVAPNGDLYVSDGYASDYIHRFDSDGNYLASFGGKEAPYNFSTLHKIAIDTRFDPPRIIGTDRANNRIVHLSLEGRFLGVVAEGLRLPAAVTIAGDEAIIGELRGRVTILNRDGKIVAHIGENEEEGVGGNSLPPPAWRPGFVVSPHGVATNSEGDLFVSEFSSFGRVHRFDKR